MKINEVIVEGITTAQGTHARGHTEPISDEAKAAIPNAQTYHDLNQRTGSAYLNYRMGIALAGAPTYPTKMAADNWIGGDPLLSTYTDVEQEIVNAAALQVGAGKAEKWSNKRSQEIPTTHKTSPVAKPKKNRYGV
jgi:hypothetical protein